MPIPGATASSYSIPAVSLGDSGSYTCVVSNNCGAPESAPAVVTVLEPVAITGQPSGATICEGTPYAFSVTATGDGLSYQLFPD